MKYLSIVFVFLLLAGCAVKPGTQVKRHGDEIMVAGELFRIGAPVVLWTDPGGYDAYRTERRFGDFDDADYHTTAKNNKHITEPNRYGHRINRFHNGRADFTADQIEQVRGGGWTLEQLRDVVDQFVIHYDVCLTSEQCFNVLHDQRGLSVHFLLDVDGTIYQTLDLKERAWHASEANSRSVGIEIANMGAWSTSNTARLDRCYVQDAQGWRLDIPERLLAGIRTPGFVARPAHATPVIGEINGRQLKQYDFTEAQYRSLTQLTAALCRIFPKIESDYPRDADGQLITEVLTPEQFAAFRGVLGHYHVTRSKVDPGPAFDWDRVIGGARGKPRR